MSSESPCHTSAPPPLLASLFQRSFRSLLTLFRTSESPCHISVPPPVLAPLPPRQSALNPKWGGHIQLPKRGMGHTQVPPPTHTQVPPPPHSQAVRVARGRRSWGRRRRGRGRWGAGRTRWGCVAQGARILKFVVLGHRPCTFSKSTLYSDFLFFT